MSDAVNQTITEETKMNSEVTPISDDAIKQSITAGCVDNKETKRTITADSNDLDKIKRNLLTEFNSNE